MDWVLCIVLKQRTLGKKEKGQDEGTLGSCFVTNKEMRGCTNVSNGYFESLTSSHKISKKITK